MTRRCVTHRIRRTLRRWGYVPVGRADTPGKPLLWAPPPEH